MIVLAAIVYDVVEIVPAERPRQTGTTIVVVVDAGTVKPSKIPDEHQVHDQ